MGVNEVENRTICPENLPNKRGVCFPRGVSGCPFGELRTQADRPAPTYPISFLSYVLICIYFRDVDFPAEDLNHSDSRWL